MSNISSVNSDISIDRNLASLSLNTNNNENSNPSNNSNSNILQNKNKSFTQPQLSSNIRKDFKRKRVDSNISLSSLTPLTPNIIDNSVSSSKPVESKPMSATARIMLKLYGDRTQQMRELNREESIKSNNKVENLGISNSSNENIPSNDITSYSKEVLQKFNEKITASNSKLLETEKLKAPLDEKIATNESDININKKDLTKENSYNTNLNPEFISSNTTLSSKSSLSTYVDSALDLSNKGFDGDIKGSIYNDTVEVILKWKDHLSDIDSNIKIYIVSKDIVSTLYSLKNEVNSSPTLFNKEANSLTMDYDSKNNEWYMKNLFLPPGIYKLQFLINGITYHSNYLPTATNTAGNIVNWFEVLPGYDVVEPFREENTYVHTRNNKYMNGNNKDQSYKSITSLTDFAGISRSSSSIDKRNSSSSFRAFGLHGFTKLEKPTPKIKYSNEVPEIFKFDYLDENMDSCNEESVTNVDDNFDSTLSKVVDINQDFLFSNIHRIGKMSTVETEEYLLTKFKVSDLPIYLNSSYLNKNFKKNNTINNITPHVNLKYLLTISVKKNIDCAGCTIMYEGTFIIQVINLPGD